jgi:hypothetical protein
MTTETGIAICEVILGLAYAGVAGLGAYLALKFDGRPRDL